MEPHIFTIDDLDDTRGKFAIEMELWFGHTWKAYKIWKELWGNPLLELKAHYECWVRVVENTIFSDDFEKKFQLFNKMCTRDRAVIGADCSIAGGCHCHVFFNKKMNEKYYVRSIETHHFRCKVALYAYMIPFYLRSWEEGVYIRKRWYDSWFYPPHGERGDIKNNYNSASIEFRMNEQVHSAVLYYRLFASTRVSHNVDIKTNFKWYRTCGNENFVNFNKETLRPIAGHKSCTNLSYPENIYNPNNKGLREIYWIKNNANLWFKSHLRLLTIDIRDLKPAYYYDRFYKEDIIKEFVAFNDYINKYVPEHHKKEVYKFFSENLRWYPKEWKREMVLSIPQEQRSNRSAMFKKLLKRLPVGDKTLQVKWELLSDWESIEEENLVLSFRDYSSRATIDKKIENWFSVQSDEFKKYCNDWWYKENPRAPRDDESRWHYICEDDYEDDIEDEDYDEDEDEDYDEDY